AVAAGDVEDIGFGVARGVAVGRAGQGDDEFAPAQGVPMQLQLARNTAAGVLHRTLVAQQLAQGPWHQLRTGAQLRPLRRVRQQGVEPVAEQVARGFVAGEQQHRALREQLGVGTDEPGLLSEYQPADQILPGRGA
ncbi:hypothetical protein RZS08_29520, partial [Arthrospira platensis SPKY1]|nr:hypothetical protein [Arthrospira platensis SPKY1]